MKLIKISENKTRFMFKSSNSFGDQILTITDGEDAVREIFNHEGNWASEDCLQEILDASEALPVILIRKM